MLNEFNSGYQYDRCVSRGICSINPATASLQEVIILYLKHLAFYGLKLRQAGKSDIRIKNLILNTISILSSNYEISKNDFEMINYTFQEELPKIIKEYKSLCKENNIKPDYLDTQIILNTNKNLTDYIRLGEKEFNKRIINLAEDIRNLYRILFILVKSICVNILTYESYGETADDEIISVMECFNILNKPDNSKDVLKDFIKNISAQDCNLMVKLQNIREKTYGKQKEENVCFSTTKGKAILVVGSNLKELERILDKTKDKNIDVYTHDNMILAHTYPKFKEYKNLKGQYGQGMENCLLDFSTFPGPVILTGQSLFNIENLYRGRLFTTGLAYSKGVVSIKNNDFSDVIKTAEKTKGFKTGKKCDSEKVGFSYKNTIELIKTKIETKKYSQILIIGIQGYSAEDKEYFKNLVEHIPNDFLTISLPCCNSTDNIICLNTNYDSFAMYKISQEIIDITNQKINLFFPYCDRHTFSIMINLSLKNVNIFFGTWNQTTINPNIIECLKTDFGMKILSTPKNDLSKLT